jgi:hypothetical protein
MLRAVSTLESATRHLQRYREKIYRLTISRNMASDLSSVQSSQQDDSDRLARTFQQCSSHVCVARSVSRNVTSDRSRSAKTLVGTSQINSLASSGFTEQHAPSMKSNTPSSLPSGNAVSRPELQSPGHNNQLPTSNIESSALSSA